MSTNYYKPRYWHIWFLFGILRVISWLPYKIQIYLGQKIGILGILVLRKRKNIAQKNLSLCFPYWSVKKRYQVLNEHFQNIGMALFEQGIAWWWSDKKISSLAKIEGVENLRKALKKNKGVILLAGHFTTLEIISRILRLEEEFHPVYRKNNHPLLEHLISSARIRHCGKLISHRNVRSLIKSLQNNIPVLYIPDRYCGRRKSIFVPFFNIQTATTPATSRLSNVLNTPVVPIIQQRLPDNKGYKLVIAKELEDFPSTNIEKDTIRINQIFEKQIRNDPANYLWTHRRFKSEPDGYTSVYELQSN